MAEIKTKICDRCGKEMKYLGWTTIFKKFSKMSYLKILNGNPDGYSYVNYSGKELCAECTKKFEEWWKEGK